MRTAFTILVLCLSAVYTWAAFTDLNFLSSTGRLGPGFFPRVLGVALILACLAELAAERRRRSEPVARSEHGWTVAMLAALTALFVLSLKVLGGLLAMIAFLLIALFYLNRGRPVQNLAVAILMPVAIYLMFDMWLNASVPPGLLGRWLG